MESIHKPVNRKTRIPDYGEIFSNSLAPGPRKCDGIQVVQQTTVRPPKQTWEEELEINWKENVADDESGTYEDNIQHAISCSCCTPIWECERNDKERENHRLHEIENKIKRSDANIRQIDKGLNVPIEQKSEASATSTTPQHSANNVEALL
jgi:hypothetical protein